LAREFINEIDRKLKSLREKELREWLVRNIKGIGWKESSHFLRNMGFKNFAILDRHVLKTLNKYGILDEIPRTLSKKIYLGIERKLKNIADHLHITLAELDLYLFYLDAGKICER
jgi:N-glycosylase/DNA lyase